MFIQKTKKLTRISKLDRILAAMASGKTVTLEEAAKIAYGARNKEAQAKVVRLLSAYRLKGKTALQIRNGKVTACL